LSHASILTATEHGFSAFLFRFQNCFLPLFHLNAAFEVSLPLLLDPPAPFLFLLLSELLSGHGLLLQLLQFALALLVVAFAQHLAPLLSVRGLS